MKNIVMKTNAKGKAYFLSSIIEGLFLIKNNRKLPLCDVLPRHVQDQQEITYP
jgi:hypothetical protein